MALTVRKAATTALRMAVLAKFGPLAAGLFLADKAAEEFVTRELAKAASELGLESLTGVTDSLVDRIGAALHDRRNHHLEESLHAATQDALKALRKEAPDFDAWFADWLKFLGKTSYKHTFSAGNADPIALESTDEEFRGHWWQQMEATLLRWRCDVNSQFQQLSLSTAPEFREPLRTLMRERFPAALRTAHDLVLRNDKKYREHWVAYQQHIYREFLAALIEIGADVKEVKADVKTLSVDVREALRHVRGEAVKVWTIHRPTETFQDRPEIVTQIETALAKRGRTALTALHGFGGIGKSQMARKYADLHRDDYKIGVWLDAQNSTSLQSSLSALAPRLGVTVQQDQQLTTAGVLEAVCAREPWLVIFDNAESIADIRKTAEALNGSGHVLITSRNENWKSLAEPVSITQWTVEESVQFLLDRTGQSDQGEAEGLAKDLDGLALALEHAAAYMLAGDGTPFAAYRKIWREKLAHVPHGNPDYAISVAATLALSLDRLQTESPVAYQLLSIFAWLAPDRIPRQELLEAGSKKLPPAIAEALSNPDQWNDVIEALSRYSLVRRERVDGIVTGYYVHRVVQQIMRDRTDKNNVHLACDLVSHAFPFKSNEPPSWAASELLLPHVRVLREHVRHQDAPVSLGRLLNQAGLYLRVRGLYTEALDFQQLALDSDLLHFGPDHPNVAACRSNLAYILHGLGRYEEAREQIQLALDSNLRHFGPDHPNIATSRSNLSYILCDLGQYDEARQQVQLALDSDLRRFGPDHPNVANHRSGFAIILGFLGQHEEARQQVQLALESDLRHFGPDHPNVATRRSNLASILGDLGQHEDARQQIQLALESDLCHFGPDHPNVASRRSNLANILLDLGRYEDARQHVQLALDSTLRHFGPDHADVAAIRSNLALILFALKQPCEALQEIDEALRILRKNFPGGHPYIEPTERSRTIFAAQCPGSR